MLSIGETMKHRLSHHAAFVAAATAVVAALSLAACSPPGEPMAVVVSLNLGGHGLPALPKS
jgi:poly(3-hydroxybutyrate) depolymerase